MLDAVFPTAAMPGAGLASALGSIQRRNIEALARAQQAAMEGFRALSRAQGEVLEAMLRDAAELPGALLQADPRAALAAPFDLAERTIRSGTARANRLGEIAAVIGADVASVLQERMLAALGETKQALLDRLPPGI